MAKSDAQVLAEITAMNKRFMTTFNEGDVEGLASIYTEDAQLLATHYDALVGRDTIRAVWQARVAPGERSVTLESLEVEGHGDTAVEVGLYSVLGSEKEVLDHGKYIVIWKHVGGQWMIHRDILNTSVPATDQ